MQVAKTIDQVRQLIRETRVRGLKIGLVPTMGALHEGHLELMRTARRECGFTAVSIFVNPIQFGPNEDFAAYPRPIESDLEKCQNEGIDLVFNPDPSEMYPEPNVTNVTVARLTENLCGAFRPGHFTGVTTVVSKLFNIVCPDFGYFGQKDVQQALVIRRMIRDLNFPVQIRICPTVRASSGLALSSRNGYLSDAERKQACCLYQSLQLAKKMTGQGERDAGRIVAAMKSTIESAGPCQIQYIQIVDVETLGDVPLVDRTVVIAMAVRIGPARLIDNIILDPTGKEIIIS